MRDRIFLGLAGCAGAISVTVDALARHALAGDAHAIELATISARYGLIHAAALLAIALLCQRNERRFWLSLAGWLFVAALILFCATLDVVVFGAPAWLLALTPVGGTAFIAGWAALLVAALTMRR